MEYVGTACATDFSSTSLQALLACLPLQDPITPLIRLGKNSKASEVAWPIAVGSPRYFSAKATFSIFSV